MGAGPSACNALGEEKIEIAKKSDTDEKTRILEHCCSPSYCSTSAARSGCCASFNNKGSCKETDAIVRWKDTSGAQATCTASQGRLTGSALSGADQAVKDSAGRAYLCCESQESIFKEKPELWYSLVFCLGTAFLVTGCLLRRYLYRKWHKEEIKRIEEEANRKFLENKKKKDEEWEQKKAQMKAKNKEKDALKGGGRKSLFGGGGGGTRSRGSLMGFFFKSSSSGSEDENAAGAPGGGLGVNLGDVGLQVDHGGRDATPQATPRAEPDATPRAEQVGGEHTTGAPSLQRQGSSSIGGLKDKAQGFTGESPGSKPLGLVRQGSRLEADP